MRYLLIGGTGTLGQALTAKILASYEYLPLTNDGATYLGHPRVTIFSRDEQKQQLMRRQFPQCRFVIGDVRDRQAVENAMIGADVVFLLAAIKHVDVAEINPLEAIKTNVLGAVIAGEAAMRAKARHFIYSNTDKAVLPITSYGYTKALAQNYLLSNNLTQHHTKFSVFNWGNIVASKGSVIPIFIDQIQRGVPVEITHLEMSRFWLKIETAVDFMLANYENAPTDRAMIPPIKAATVYRVINSLARLLGDPAPDLKVTGLRCVEKIHEVLESSHDHCLRSDTCMQYDDAELDELLRGCL